MSALAKFNLTPLLCKIYILLYKLYIPQYSLALLNTMNKESTLTPKYWTDKDTKTLDASLCGSSSTPIGLKNVYVMHGAM